MKSELTQIREGNRKLQNWRIVAGILVLLLAQAVLGRMDSEAHLAEVERLAQRQSSTGSGRTGEVKPLQRQALILNKSNRGVL